MGAAHVACFGGREELLAKGVGLRTGELTAEAMGDVEPCDAKLHMASGLGSLMLRWLAWMR